jgi:hypothetical protein
MPGKDKAKRSHKRKNDPSTTAVAPNVESAKRAKEEQVGDACKLMMIYNIFTIMLCGMTL